MTDIIHVLSTLVYLYMFIVVYFIPDRKTDYIYID